MGALYERYARPFEYVDQVIRFGRFDDFVLSFWEEKNDREIMDVWLHKSWDKTFAEFKQQVLFASRPHKTNPKRIEATVKQSLAILEGFNPDTGEVSTDGTI